jgi:2-polyprenyl-3-methyl-5-hydroxy-6-metoxy-1,4-benzoquinol methylase
VYASPDSYWRNRYRKFGASLTGPGCVALSEQENHGDYDAKWVHISSALLKSGSPQGKSLLDAGCGLGTFTEKFVSLGYSVSAVDFAQNAVESARRRIGENVRWYVDSLTDFSPGQTFDVVACIDVLFHITDDELFRRAVSNLARLTSSTGLLVIQEHLVPETDVIRNYSASARHARWRSLERYASSLEPEWRLVTHDHYELPGERETKDLLVFATRGLG